MPNVDELKKIKEELRLIGDEPRVLKEWGEEYVDLPLPTVSMPDLDVDNLLGSIDVESNVESLVDEVAHTEPEPFSPEAFAGLADVVDEAPGMVADFEPVDDIADIMDLTATEPSIPEVSEPEISIPEVSTPEASEPEDEASQTEQFDDLLSDLNLDDIPTADIADTDVPDLPEDLLSEDIPLADLMGESAIDTTDDVSVPASMPADDDIDQGGDSSGFEEINLDDISMGNVTDPITENFDFTEMDSDMSADNAGIDEMSSPVLDEVDFASPTSDDTEIDIQDGALSDFDLESGSTEPESSENASATMPEFDLSSMDSESMDGALDAESLISDPSESGESEDDPYKPVEDISALDINMPEIDEKTGFRKDPNAEPSSAGGFQVPSNFEEFSDDDYKSFQPKEESDKSAKMDPSGKIPLEISEKDFKYFLKRLSTFPLNVRKEIQNYIGNEKDSEVNKMELVDLIVKNTSLRRVAQYLEKALKKSIRIPRDFERKNVLEYEREKKTFKYRLMHQIIPLASIALVILLLTASVGVLIWHFAYKPIVAENFYRDGIYYIENEKYNTAINRFDKAGTYWKKRHWYFKYADEFRQRKQYGSAESIYLRLLYDFNHDVEGGIAYAQMLADDLRNYEKAETVIRRQVLDFHINNPEALAALGNIYLDWGDEIPEKYEEAAKIFSSLLKDDPVNDLYNAGMMKYYIRTDNLAKVLPLKDYFLRPGVKISAEDLTELGTYLLEKRYNPKPSDDNELRSAIDDVREILEKSYKMHSDSPEANYNLGRFFLYNYKPTEAEFYLKGAIKAYSDIMHLSPRRFIKKIDSMRLYGEILLSQNKEIEAEKVFSNALSFYREYVEFGELPPNKIVGKLFEDYGNLKYFIANDYELALDAYSHAVRQLNDTPNIYYKLGFINYKLGNYPDSIKNMSLAYMQKPDDRNLLFALGNVLFKRGDFYSAQAYYERLMENLESERLRKGILFPQIRADHGEFVQRYMKGANNLGVVLNRLANQTGDSIKNARSFSLLAESSRAWDALTRNPETMIRVKNEKSGAYVNIQYMTVPDRSFIPEIYSEISKTLEGEKVLQQKQDR